MRARRRAASGKHRSATTATVRELSGGQCINDMASEPREEGPSVQQSIQGPNEDAKSVDNLMKDAEQPVYKGCKNFSILSFIRQLYHLKCLNGWCNESFTMLLQLLQDMLPSDAKVPKDSYEFEKIVKDLGLSNEKSHACPSGCMLLEKGNSNDEACSVCGFSKWATDRDEVQSDTNALSNKKKKRRLQRSYMDQPLLTKVAEVIVHCEGYK